MTCWYTLFSAWNNLPCAKTPYSERFIKHLRWSWKLALLRALVRMSAYYTADATYSTLIFRVLNRSRMKWKRTPVCLLLAEFRELSISALAPWLSSRTSMLAPLVSGIWKTERHAQTELPWPRPQPQCTLPLRSTTTRRAVSYSRGLQKYLPKLLLSQTPNVYIMAISVISKSTGAWRWVSLLFKSEKDETIWRPSAKEKTCHILQNQHNTT